MIDDKSNSPILTSREKCTGCGACVHICPNKCIEMQEDLYGFSFPVLSNLQDCIQCRSCEQICPIAFKHNNSHNKPIAYAAYTCNENVRKCSSSGGIFTEIAKRTIEKRGFVCGAAFDDQYQVKHIIVTEIEDLSRLRGAKYSESKLGDIFSVLEQLLLRGAPVLFAGTPCQTAGFKAFLKREYQNLTCLDFVCHGIPSPKAWGKYVEFRSKKDANGHNPVSVKMRSKETGWTNYNYSVQFSYNNFQYSSVSSKDPFMKLFINNTIIRDSCGNCLFKGTNHYSDITLGDFWGIWDIDPSMDDNGGTSLVLLNSEKGSKVFEEIKNTICYREENFEEAGKYNPSILFSSKIKKNKNKELSILINNGFEYYLFTRRITRKLKSIVRKVTGYDK